LVSRKDIKFFGC